MKVALKGFSIVLFILCISCSSKKSSDIEYKDYHFDGVLSTDIYDFPKTLFPPLVSSESEKLISQQLYQSLFRTIGDSVYTDIVETFAYDSTSTVLILNIKQNLFFNSTDKYDFNNILDAYDIESALKFVLNRDNNKDEYALFMKACIADTNNIRVNNSYQIEIQCSSSSHAKMLPKYLANVHLGIYPKELASMLRSNRRLSSVGSGKFILENVNQTSIELRSNDD